MRTIADEVVVAAWDASPVGPAAGCVEGRTLGRWRLRVPLLASHAATVGRDAVAKATGVRLVAVVSAHCVQGNARWLAGGGAPDLGATVGDAVVTMIALARGAAMADVTVSVAGVLPIHEAIRMGAARARASETVPVIMAPARSAAVGDVAVGIVNALAVHKAIRMRVTINGLWVTRWAVVARLAPPDMPVRHAPVVATTARLLRIVIATPLVDWHAHALFRHSRSLSLLLGGTEVQSVQRASFGIARLQAFIVLRHGIFPRRLHSRRGKGRGEGHR